MFGTLKPVNLGLDRARRQEWRRFYCGTCQGLGDQFGLAYRGLLSHDAVFLGLLVDGLQVDAARPDRTRCPMVPVVHRATVRPDSVAMRYAAAVQILLADQWLADRGADGPGLARAARPLLREPSARARATLDELGSDLGALIGFEQRQAATELPGTTGPDEAAEPTAAALELVFARITGLPGGVPELQAQAQAGCLARLGRAVGLAIYLIDALEDLAKDLREGAFNPCLVHDFRGRAEPDRRRVELARARLDQAQAEIETCLGALPLRRHRTVLVNILVTGLGAQARLAGEAAAQVCAGAATRPKLAVVAGLHGFGLGMVRVTQALAALMFAIVTTTWSRLVQAATETGGTETETGTETGGTETGTETAGELGESLPDLPPDLPGETGQDGGVGDTTDHPDNCLSRCIEDLCDSLCGGIGDICGGCVGQVCGPCGEDCTGFCSVCGEGCGEGCSKCGECGDVCSGCGDACSSCGECGNVCSGCGECGNACSGCGDCGNACSGCGNCGNGCSGCGNCGNGCNC